MSILEVLGNRIRGDVDAMLASRVRIEPPELPHLDDDDHHAALLPSINAPRRGDDVAAATYALENPSVPAGMPVHGRMSSRFGLRFHPIQRRWRNHNGEDIAAPAGSPVASTADGIVSFAGSRSGYGNTIEIDHGRGMKTRYAHLRDISVSTGARVSRGDSIGTVGQTGLATGPHLHYEVLQNNRFRDPRLFMSPE